MSIQLTPEASPEPGWRAVFSSVDLPAARPEVAAHLSLFGVPAVCTIDGRPMVFTTSPMVPAGQVYVINEEALRA